MFTDDDYRAAHDRIMAGETRKEVAYAMKITSNQLKARLRALGLPVSRRGMPGTRSKLEAAALECRERGMSVREIARALDMTPEVVRTCVWIARLKIRTGTRRRRD